MDLAGAAVLLASISGAVLGTLGFLQSRKRDTTAAETMASDVATKAADSAVGALKEALGFLRNEVKDLRGQVSRLRARVDECESEKQELRALLEARG